LYDVHDLRNLVAGEAEQASPSGFDVGTLPAERAFAVLGARGISG
jgi:hypothetical protein